MLSKISSVAKNYIKVKEKIVELEKEKKDLEKLLIDNGESVLIPDINKKVTFIEAKVLTKINVEKVVDKLLKEKREEDLKNVVTVKEKDLLTLEDGEKILKEAKETKGLSKPSLRVTKLTKDDLKKLEEENKID